MIALTSFATDDFVPAQLIQAQSARQQGAQKLSMWRTADLKATAFYADHKEILDLPRGAGYWLWKPWIILTELEQLADGDWLIYSDCGKTENPHSISRPLEILTEWCHANVGGMLPGVYVPQYGRNARWTKGECFSVMDCDAPAYRDHPQFAATFSVWEKHQDSLDFVRTWLNWCSNPAALIDDHIDPSIPDAPDFRQHRHDQSVLTLLALKRGLKSIGAPWEGHPRPKKIDYLIDRITGRIPAESYAASFPSLAGV